jgi:hypothetical protein
LAWRVFSVFCLTVAVSSSIEEAVSSSEPACCSVREDRSILPAAISVAAVTMESAPLRTWPTISARLSRMPWMANSRLRWSPAQGDRHRQVAAGDLAAMAATSPGSPPSCASNWREISQPAPRPAPSTAAQPSATLRDCW